MGDVFDAIHTSLDKRVAIKTLRRRYLEDQVVVARFLREGQLASRMRHPNIVDVTDVGVIDGLPCLVMEHLEGETLSQLIRREGPMQPSALIDFLLPIVAAVDFAHDHGVLHRDLKPSNIFLSRSWNGEVHPKVLDFGISKLVHESAEAALTTDSAFVGTPHYASPESVRVEKAVDRRADQYSMGVILYEGVTGVRPFNDKGGSFVTMAMAICNADFAPPRAHKPDLPEALERVILRAMALRVDDRFVDMRRLGAALLPFASDRARVIWTPTFDVTGVGVDDRPGEPRAPDTRVLHTAASLGPHLAHVPSSPSHPPFTATGPVKPQSWLASMVLPYGAMPAAPPPSFGGLPGAAQALLSTSGQNPHLVTMNVAQDGTPSFGAGMNSSIYAPPAKRSAAPLVAMVVLALVAVSSVGFVFVTRASTKQAHVGSDADPISSATTFSVDVTTTPEVAILELDGVPAGSGRLTKQLPRDAQRHVLRVSAPGYETLLVEFDATRPPPTILGLRSAAAGVASSVLAGKGVPGATAGRPPVVAASAAAPVPGVRPGANGNATSNGNGKPKPDRPRTDNIDPWE